MKKGNRKENLEKYFSLLSPLPSYLGQRASALGLLPTGEKEKGGVGLRPKEKNRAGRQLALGRIGGDRESNEKYFSIFLFHFQTEFKYESN